MVAIKKRIRTARFKTKKPLTTSFIFSDTLFEPDLGDVPLLGALPPHIAASP
jgi:hypothetical protein